MLKENVGIMLYVDDVQKEKEFWKNIGFEIISEKQMMGYDTFEMKSNKNSTCMFTVFSKEFISSVSPEVADNQPSVMFECTDINEMHEIISRFTDIVGNISDVPFPNFNFRTPSGNYYAIRQA